MSGNTRATNGAIYVCGACGKTSTTRYGFDGNNKSTASGGWDESCMLNAVLCREDSIERDDSGRITNARAVGEQLEPGHEEPVLPGSIQNLRTTSASARNPNE